MRLLFSFSLLVVLVTLASCGQSVQPPISLNNAAEFCLDEGGRYILRDGDYGKYGVCSFGEKGECEEWAFYREECLVHRQG